MAGRRSVGGPARLAGAILMVFVLGAFPLVVAAAPTAGSAVQGGVSALYSCTPKFGSTPSALSIPGTNPSGTLGAGGNVTVTFEFKPTKYSASNTATNVYIPSVFANFPLSGGGTLSVYFAPRVIAVKATSSWTSPSLASKTVTVGSSVTFASGSNATLSTQKLAVMANTAYANLYVAFRWQWVETTSLGLVTTGAWSVPTSTAFHPSIFPPAPYVSVNSKTASPAALGTKYTARLVGAISSQSFFMELENASTGNVVLSYGVNAPAGNSTPFPASIQLTSTDDDLGPGSMLVHIHNYCGAMLASLGVRTFLAKTASVTLSTSRTACPTVDFNGSAYLSGHVVSATPSMTSYSITAPSCSGHSFSSWSVTGTLDVAAPTNSSTSVLVTNSGTLQAVYS